VDNDFTIPPDFGKIGEPDAVIEMIVGEEDVSAAISGSSSLASPVPASRRTAASSVSTR